MQGDILVPTIGLRELFKKIHPHFDNDKYLGFIITTQTCDLVRRGALKQPKAQYINIAAVRPLEQMLIRFLDATCKPLSTGIYSQENKQFANELLYRIVNQNESNLGLFYLHPEKNIKILEPSVAMLRVHVALKAENYQILQEARRGRFEEIFQHKLAWMVGHIYSRIGTRDWNEDSDDKKNMRKAIKEHLKHCQINDCFPYWIPTEAAKSIEESKINISGLTKDEIETLVTDHTPPAKIDQAINAAEKILSDPDFNIDKNDLLKITSRLRSNMSFKQLFS